ncbi:hypothetical protein F8M41_004348 [Gigaspora margarita]|uniref:F-box domain-containing protein n=1 Tax=Gigaspora margarita TaxID=4874 RepID=A0A8H4A700_GIGMA|nr:hypothetical protein F8M41_004348 [Gigaspora margarita]
MIETLPLECLLEILKLRNEKLFPCLLVNRRWCRIVVPLLWKNMDFHLYDGRLIRTCLSALNAEEQAFLIPFEISLPSYSKPLFEYTNYTTSISDHMNIGIIDWFDYYDESVEDVSIGLQNALRCSLIAMFLRTNKKLKHLKVNGIIYEEITKDFCRNNTITTLELQSNNFSSKELMVLKEAIANNTTLTSLSLYDSARYQESPEDLYNSRH